MDAAGSPPRSLPKGRWAGAVMALVALGALLASPPGARADAAAVDFGYEPVVPLVGQPVTFTAVGSPETGATLTNYRWDLDGDGSFELNTGLATVAVATYPVAGTLTVTVQLRDSLGNRVNRSRVLTVGGQAPIASFTFAPAAPVANQPVVFTSASSDPDGTLARQDWDLDGNGVFDNGGGPTAVRTFAAPGVYVVGLRVTDNEAHSSYYSQTLTVQGAALRLLSPFPVVRFSGALTKRGARLRVVSIGAPPGSVVRVRCAGRSCPFTRKVRFAASAGGRIRIEELETSLLAGVRIRIYVTSPGTIGKYTVYTIRRGSEPRREDSCVVHGSSTPVPCRRG